MDSIEIFENEAVVVENLPKYEDVSLQPLHRDYLKVMLLSAAIAILIPIIAFSIISYFAEVEDIVLKIGIPILIAYSIVVVAAALIGFKTKGYAIRTHDVIYKSGFLSISTTIVPFNRVQHIALHESAFARLFNLASIELFTAGDESNDLEINGLPKELALQLKEFLATKISGQ